MLGSRVALGGCMAAPAPVQLPAATSRLAHQVELEVGAIEGRSQRPQAVVSGAGVSASLRWTVKPRARRSRRTQLAALQRQRSHGWGLAEQWSERCRAELQSQPSPSLIALAAAWDLEVW